MINDQRMWHNVGKQPMTEMVTFKVNTNYKLQSSQRARTTPQKNPGEEAKSTPHPPPKKKKNSKAHGNNSKIFTQRQTESKPCFGCKTWRFL